MFPELIKKFMTHAAAGSFFSGYYNTSILALVMIILFAHTSCAETLVSFKDYLVIIINHLLQSIF